MSNKKATRIVNKARAAMTEAVAPSAPVAPPTPAAPPMPMLGVPAAPTAPTTMAHVMLGVHVVLGALFTALAALIVFTMILVPALQRQAAMRTRIHDLATRQRTIAIEIDATNTQVRALQALMDTVANEPGKPLDDAALQKRVRILNHELWVIEQNMATLELGQ